MGTQEKIEEFVSVRVAANRIGYAVGTLYNLIYKKAILFIKEGRRVYVLLSELFTRIGTKRRNRNGRFESSQFNWEAN
jgi:hypothetical protein